MQAQVFTQNGPVTVIDLVDKLNAFFINQGYPKVCAILDYDNSNFTWEDFSTASALDDNQIIEYIYNQWVEQVQHYVADGRFRAESTPHKSFTILLQARGNSTIRHIILLMSFAP